MENYFVMQEHTRMFMVKGLLNCILTSSALYFLTLQPQSTPHAIQVTELVEGFLFYLLIFTRVHTNLKTRYRCELECKKEKHNNIVSST